MHQKQELKKDKARAAAMFGGKSKTKAKAKNKPKGKANGNRAPPPPPADPSPLTEPTEPPQTEYIPKKIDTPQDEEYDEVDYEPAWYQEHQE
eukprot:CAMPEP_0194415334 /NCGR_PEP_ID=MMETSP0176-20130528/14087_1 /TAXON_ID=216777 /ORGANISM="Proboscia alata, Strain PI-D3" /LENGTH=91 /DNA_ID=CAMNT_0039219893 /DNA_START=1 /DNA_END=273 /DNA_ORIENTATION=-